MNKKRLVILILLFSMVFTLTACTSEKENESNVKETSQSSEIKEGNETNEGTESETNQSSETIENDNHLLPEHQTLNAIVLSSYDYRGISIDTQRTIKETMKETYPDFKLNLETFYDKASYDSSIQASIMSGQPYDLIYADKDLQIDKLVESEYIKDIYELIESDESGSIYDYHVNALRAFESNGKLYRMPINFVYDYLIGINTKEFPESIVNYQRMDNISFNSMIDIFKQNQGYNSHAIINNSHYSFLIEPSMASYIDFDNSTCDFNNSRFKSFLTDIRDTLFFGGYETYYENQKVASFYTQEDDIMSSSQSMFTPRYGMGMDQAFIEYADPYFEHFVPLANAYDESIISSNMVYCIGNTENAEMAWDFLNIYININNGFVISSTVLPIKKEFLDFRTNALIHWAFAKNTGKNISWGVGYSITGGGDGYGGDLLYDAETTVIYAIEKIKKFNEMPMAVVQQLDTDGSLYTETIDNFMKGLITVDQAAEQIQNAMSLYLSE